MKKQIIMFGEKEEKRVLEFISAMCNDSAEMIAYYNFREQNEQLPIKVGLKGFKTYKNKYRIDKKFDCDCCDLVMQIWCLIVKMAKNARNISYSGRVISYETEDGKHFKIETDTMNSLETSFNGFTRKIIEGKYKTSWADLYTKGKGVCGSEIINNKWTKTDEDARNRDEWLLEYWDEIFNFEKETGEGKAYLQYEEFANLIHTLGNFLLGPEGFNCKSPNAKSKFADKICLFLPGIWNKQHSCQECLEWVQWFQDNQDILFLEDFCEGGDIFAKGSFADLTEIETVNDLIRKRGIRIAKWLLTQNASSQHTGGTQ